MKHSDTTPETFYELFIKPLADKIMELINENEPDIEGAEYKRRVVAAALCECAGSILAECDHPEGAILAATNHIVLRVRRTLTEDAEKAAMHAGKMIDGAEATEH